MSLWFAGDTCIPWNAAAIFIKNLAFVITLEPLEVTLSYFTCTFLVVMTFWSYQHFWPSDYYNDIWPIYLKTLTLTITFEPWEIETSCLACLSPYKCNFSAQRPTIAFMKTTRRWEEEGGRGSSLRTCGWSCWHPAHSYVLAKYENNAKCKFWFNCRLLLNDIKMIQFTLEIIQSQTSYPLNKY